MPKIAEIESTPNPNAMKFILREPLTWGITRSYDKPEQAVGDPLALKLFDIAHVTNVFYVDHWGTVTQDGSADWQDLMRDLAVPIREASAADANSDKLAAQASEAMDPAKLSPADRERLDKINAILDEQMALSAERRRRSLRDRARRQQAVGALSGCLWQLPQFAVGHAGRHREPGAADRTRHGSDRGLNEAK